MNDSQEFREGIQYSELITNAVRYGYLYRKEAEKCGNRRSFCLDDVSPVLLFLANIIIGGITWDAIKGIAKKLYHKVFNNRKQLEETAASILTDDRKLKEFYFYILEFHEHRLNVNDTQLKFIKEEIIADYFGKEYGRIWSRENRLPTHEENLKIVNEAFKHVDSLFGKESSESI